MEGIPRARSSPALLPCPHLLLLLALIHTQSPTPPHPTPPHPLQGVDLSALLFNIHDFFLYLGVDEIRKRSSSDDKPLRMVKTILHELCKMLVGGRGAPGCERAGKAAAQGAATCLV